MEVQRVEEHKHLSLILNKTCTWNNHILDITSKAWKRIHILQALKFKLDRKHWKLYILHLLDQSLNMLTLFGITVTIMKLKF